MTQKKIPLCLKKRNDELNQLTIESVTQAFLQLLDIKEYEKITVTDICERSGISRNTFYKNFQTKENVFKRIVLDFNKDVIFRKFGSPFNKRVGVEWYFNFFTTVKEYVDLFNLIIRTNFKNIYLDYVNDLLTANPNLDPVTRYTRLLWNGAIQNAALEWLRNDMKESVQEIATLCFERLSPMLHV